MTVQTEEKLPHWDMTSVYPGLDSPEFLADFDRLPVLVDALEADLNGVMAHPASTAPSGDALASLIDQINVIATLENTLHTYLTGFTAVDSFNAEARKIESALRVRGARFEDLFTRFRAWVGSHADHLDALIDSHPTARAHAFALRESARLSRYQMASELETLAAELSLSGAQAWGKLQGVITSQMTVPFELDGEMKDLPMPALINLRSHPDESVRRRAYEAEMQAWPTVEEPLAAAINGVKGESITLARHRGRPDELHAALDASRIDRETLDAMISAMVDSLPAFRRFFRAKARRLGKERLAWWDLFAPLGSAGAGLSWSEVQRFLLEHFDAFSPDLGRLARRAFDERWIDAEPRPGKRGGAFCAGLPGVKQSRVLTNFDGSLDQLFTVAHELGHAFHNACIYAAGKTMLQADLPMTLAETASIMNETIIQQAVLAGTTDREAELAILDTSLTGDAQVIVDIYSRFLFEREVFARRAEAELSAQELCEIMRHAQVEAYGDGLDEQYLMPYMWTWKPHYYFAGLDFYNFPYAFGLLFGLGLYAIYRQRGATFIPDYQDLLASTGEDSAANLAARFGMDIRKKDFWASSLQVIADRIERYEGL